MGSGVCGHLFVEVKRHAIALLGLVVFGQSGWRGNSMGPILDARGSNLLDLLGSSITLDAMHAFARSNEPDSVTTYSGHRGFDRSI